MRMFRFSEISPFHSLVIFFHRLNHGLIFLGNNFKASDKIIKGFNFFSAFIDFNLKIRIGFNHRFHFLVIFSVGIGCGNHDHCYSDSDVDPSKMLI